MDESGHMDAAFDADLNAILTLLMSMGGLVEQAVRNSTEALHDRNSELAACVISDDSRIDQLLEDINDCAVNLIALRQPKARDLRMVIAVIRISQFLERAGDYAKNIAKRAVTITGMDPELEGDGSIRRLAISVESLTKDSLDSFVYQDVDKASDVIQRDIEIDRMHNSLFRKFVNLMMEDPGSIEPTLHLLSVAKNLERIGDYATAISEQTIYMVTGSHIAEQRQKEDLSSFLRKEEADGNQEQ